MDVQIATKLNGTLHAVSIPQTEVEACHFATTMTRQGLTVTRLTQAAAARFKRLKFAGQESEPPTPSPAEALALQQVQVETLPARGTAIRYPLDGRPITGTVSHSLRWPLDHPHCPGRVAVVALSPGHTRCVDAGDFEIVAPEQPAPVLIPDDTAETPAPTPAHPPKPPAPVSVQPGLW